MEKLTKRQSIWRSNEKENEKIVNQKEIKMDNFMKVPHEIMLIIMNFLDGISLLNLSMANRKLRYHAQDNLLWLEVCLREYPVNMMGIVKDKKRTLVQDYKWMDIWKEFDRKNYTFVFTEKENFAIPNRWYESTSDENHPKVIKTNHEFFELFVVFVSIYPGTYELIWEMKIGTIHEGCNFKFNTKVIDHNWNKILKTYSYKPKPEEFKKMSKQGWCNFKVPNKIVVEHEQHVKTEFRRYTTLEENEGSLWFESLELYCVHLQRCTNDALSTPKKDQTMSKSIKRLTKMLSF
ncbi:8087_t:CDS:2 [Funneliformis mosseae]|uniref:8087_t:CDS:1 n=1 Tax=Funneliformis mosseae TaxID=27381 RepID=A0A9N9F0K8_FUNMO|nr:8087_t:CDS:2 [Funneliformis mosseae]